MITKHELMMRIINIEDNFDVLEERVYELELKIKKLENANVKKTTKKVNKKG